jgi:hypothetical protein
LQRLGVVLTAGGRTDEAWDVLGEGLVAAERAIMRSHCLTRIFATSAGLMSCSFARRVAAVIEVWDIPTAGYSLKPLLWIASVSPRPSM